MKIEILGTGCTKCNMLYEAAKAAVADTGVEAEVTHVTELAEVMKRGVMTTPALMIDGRLRSAGRVLKPGEIAKMLV
jgi:small redox-active disulfide protein 2